MLLELLDDMLLAHWHYAHCCWTRQWINATSEAHLMGTRGRPPYLCCVEENSRNSDRCFWHHLYLICNACIDLERLCCIVVHDCMWHMKSPLYPFLARGAGKEKYVSLDLIYLRKKFWPSEWTLHERNATIPLRTGCFRISCFTWHSLVFWEVSFAVALKCAAKVYLWPRVQSPVDYCRKSTSPCMQEAPSMPHAQSCCALCAMFTWRCMSFQCILLLACQVLALLSLAFYTPYQNEMLFMKVTSPHVCPHLSFAFVCLLAGITASESYSVL